MVNVINFAKQGDVTAQYELASRYHSGYGGRKNYKRQINDDE